MTDCKLTDAERVAFAAHQARGCTPKPDGWRGEMPWWPYVLSADRSWRDWYDGDEYLGLRSGRTGPDACGVHRCECEQCRPEERS